MRVLIACEESQIVAKAFRDRGHIAFSCDLLDCSGGHDEWHIKEDVVKVMNRKGGCFTTANGELHIANNWDLMIAHPTCTRLTNAGVRWLHKPPRNKTIDEMWRDLYEGVKFYKAFQDCDIPQKAIENPVMHKYARWMIGNIERQIVQPWWFGDKAFKATGFELYGLPELIATDKLTPPKPGAEEHKEWSKIHRMPPGPDRAKLRSKTFPGIAKAMAEQWGRQ